MGSMIKVVVLVLIALFVLRLVKRLFGSSNIANTTQSKNEAIELKPCAYCGAHVYEKQAVIKKGQVFCSEGHAKKLHERKG